MSSANSHPLPQKQLVDRFLSWERVETRLDLYPAVKDTFPLSMLRKAQNNAPYFCHYMAWRLGVWEDETAFVRLNDLLDHAASLPGWGNKSSMLQSPDFDEYWSLLFELQVAKFLGQNAKDVRWLHEGPDLRATVNGEHLYVECYCYRKWFGVKEFVYELAKQIGRDLDVEHQPYLPLSIPNDGERGKAISDLVAPLLNGNEILAARDQTKAKWPVVLSREASGSLVLCVKGDTAEAYDPNVLGPNATGDPAAYIMNAVSECLNNKKNSNKLDKHKPNIQVVSFLLGDAQGALVHETHPFDLTKIALPVAIDGVALVVVGIDEEMEVKNVRRVITKSKNHPFHTLAPLCPLE